MANSGASLNWGGLDAALGHAGKKLGNTQALMESVGEALVSGTRQRFSDEEDPKGQKWPRSGRAAESGGQTLTDTGRLRDSIEYAATPNKVMVGSNLVYAGFIRKAGQSLPRRQKSWFSPGAAAKRQPLTR